MVQGEAGVDEVDGLAGVLVGQEAGSDDVYVAQIQILDLGCEPVQHRLGHVDRDHARANAGYLDGELARSGAELQDQGLSPQACALQHRHLAVGARVLLGVVAPDVGGVQVLPAGVARLVDQPAGCATRAIRAHTGDHPIGIDPRSSGRTTRCRYLTKP
jgi:hypothetical protein